MLFRAELASAICRAHPGGGVATQQSSVCTCHILNAESLTSSTSAAEGKMRFDALWSGFP